MLLVFFVFRTNSSGEFLGEEAEFEPNRWLFNIGLVLLSLRIV